MRSSKIRQLPTFYRFAASSEHLSPSINLCGNWIATTAVAINEMQIPFHHRVTDDCPRFLAKSTIADDDQGMGSNNSAHTQAIPPKSKLLWYKIGSVLGQGGFGITYLARDPNLDENVAIKEYLPSAFASRDIEGQVKPLTPDHEGDYRWGLERFIDEGRTLARFDHPGIVRVLSVFEENSTAYLVMRYEKGESMSAILKRERTIAEPQLRQIMGEIMEGLEQVHEAGFIHRDIKPANIYIRENGSAVLLDFGAARQALGIQTQTLTTLVSPGYAPFEQYYSNGTAQGPWTDIYALGATAYRSITGKAPLPAVDRSQMLINGRTRYFSNYVGNWCCRLFTRLSARGRQGARVSRHGTTSINRPVARNSR